MGPVLKRETTWPLSVTGRQLFWQLRSCLETNLDFEESWGEVGGGGVEIEREGGMRDRQIEPEPERDKDRDR